MGSIIRFTSTLTVIVLVFIFKIQQAFFGSFTLIKIGYDLLSEKNIGSHFEHSVELEH